MLSSCCITTCILHQMSAMSSTVHHSRDEGCLRDSEARRASAVLMPPLPPVILPYSSLCCCPVSSREEASRPHHHLSPFTHSTPASQGLPKTCLIHDHFRGRDVAVYLQERSDVLKVTVANAFNLVVLHPRWLIQDQFSGWTKMGSLVGLWCSWWAFNCSSQQKLKQSVWLAAKWESSCEENTI